MKVGDSVVYISNESLILIYGNSYIISEIIDVGNESDDYKLCLVEGKSKVYHFLTDFVTIKEFRKIKLKKINEKRR